MQKPHHLGCAEPSSPLRSCWISSPPDGPHACIHELSLLSPRIPHGQARSPHHPLPHLHFQLPRQTCELCPEEHHHTLGASCPFSGISVHQSCLRPQERWGRAGRELDRLLSRGGGFPRAPAKRTRACTCSASTHGQPPACPSGRLPRAEDECSPPPPHTPVRAAPPEVRLSDPRQRGPCRRPETGSSWARVSLSPRLPSQGQSGGASWSAQPACR